MALARRAASAAALAVLLLALASVAGAAYRDRVLPGVHAADLELTALSASGARARLVEAGRTLAASPLVVEAGGRRWTATHAEAGIALDADRAVAEALAAGKADGLLAAVRDVIAARTHDDIGWPRLVADRGRLDGFMDAIARGVESQPTDGDVALGPDGVLVRAPAAGIRFDRDALVAEILSRRERAPVVTAELVRIAPDLDEDGIRQAREAASAAHAPLTLVAGSEQVTLTAARVSSVVRIRREESEGPDRLTASVDDDAVRALVDELAGRLDGEAREALLVPGEDRLSVVAGRDGVVVDRTGAAAALAAAVFAPAEERVVTVPAAVVRPALTNREAEWLASQVRLAGSYTTYFPVNEARANNIGLAARRFDGIVLRPGESFSFWDRIGEVSARTGYVAAGTIIDGHSSTAIGGGLCQVSTTLFNAVARAGYRVDERHQHSYYIERYPLGMDAAVLYPTGFRWTNDTTSTAYLRAQSDDTSVTFWLYAVPSGREALLLTPVEANLRYPAPDQPADPAHAPGYVVPGRDVWVTRIVYQDGAEFARDVWYSHYAPVWGGPAR